MQRPAFAGQDIVGVPLEAALVQRLAGQQEEAVFVIDVAAPPGVPLVPTLNGFGGQGTVEPVAAVVHPHHLADVVGGGGRMRHRAGVDDGDLVAPLPQSQGAGKSEDTGANYHH